MNIYLNHPILLINLLKYSLPELLLLDNSETISVWPESMYHSTQSTKQWWSYQALWGFTKCYGSAFRKIMKHCLIITKGRRSCEPSGGQLSIHPQKSEQFHVCSRFQKMLWIGKQRKVGYWIWVIIETIIWSFSGSWMKHH